MEVPYKNTYEAVKENDNDKLIKMLKSALARKIF